MSGRKQQSSNNRFGILATAHRRRVLTAAAQIHCWPTYRVDALERRLLLSAYTFHPLATLPNDKSLGTDPNSTLIADNSGNFYGTTNTGGIYGEGTVYEVVKGSGAVTTLASFDMSSGGGPMGLAIDGNGNLYGTTQTGGADSDGTVFEIVNGSGTITTLATFSGDNGANPHAGVIVDGSGNLYGTTYYGGAAGEGVVFELAKGSATISVLASFGGANGANPAAAVVMDANGNLFGTAQNGGTKGDGAVFELVKGSGSITCLASFNGSNGSAPSDPVVLDGSGNLYGTTQNGGGYGSVFEVAYHSNSITTLASFAASNGAYPVDGLVIDNGGNLYGTTQDTGQRLGTIFEVVKGSGAITDLASFNGANGKSPTTGLWMDSSGNFYGTASAGGPANAGVVYELAQGSGNITVVAAFGAADNGENPWNAPVMDSSGNLYGTTTMGGAYGAGVVWELAAGSGTLTDLVSFNGIDGTAPSSKLLLDASGNLYGTTLQGGAYGMGVVFEIVKDSGTITDLASFNGTNGQGPTGDLAFDGGGNLYGSTAYGGSGYGTVYELANDSGTITDLAWFNGTDGYTPTGVMIDSSGNLYGMTSTGGANGDGNVFEVAKGSGTITVLASFTGANGNQPDATPIMDSGGNLYGTCTFGGAHSYGVIFEVVKGSGVVTDLFAFDNQYNDAYPSGDLLMDRNGRLFGTCTVGGGYSCGFVFEFDKGATSVTDLGWCNSYGTGDDTYSGVVMDSSGNFYGTTVYGGADNDGIVFEIVNGSGTLGALAAFGPSNWGNWPMSGLVMDANGNLYGAASTGGAYDLGAVFEVASGSNSVSVLASFDGANGATPEAGLAIDSAGNLYGTTVTGGPNWDGSVFEIVKGSGSVTTLAMFDGGNGYAPQGGLILDSSGNIYGTAFPGIVFEIVEGTNTITDLASLDFAQGALPEASLVMDSSGNLYGTTIWGGANSYGTVFEVAKGTNSVTVLGSFSGATGSGNCAPLIMDGNGNLYGITENLGLGVNDGTVYEVAKGSNSITVLASFNGNNGSVAAWDGLQMDANGNLFGTTSYGGAYGGGTFFEIAKGSKSITTLLSFKVGSPCDISLMDAHGNFYGTSDINFLNASLVFELQAPQLVFTQQPGNVTTGNALGTVQVAVEDSSGSIATDDTSNITLSITSGPGGGNLGGTVTVAAVNGVATFNNLTLSPAGTYTLMATDADNSNITVKSQSFVVGAPQIANVTVDGSAWSSGFLGYLAGLNAANVGGYSIPTGSAQPKTLPWTNLNQINITFTQNVNVTQSSLQLVGVNVPSYSFSNFSYNSSTDMATWTLNAPIGDDKLLIDLSGSVSSVTTGVDLDGAWTDGVNTYPSGNGTAGTPFVFSLNVLPGDVNQSNGVSVLDTVSVAHLQGSSTATPTTYSILADVNGSGGINIQDTLATNSRQGSALPSGSPTTAVLTVAATDWSLTPTATVSPSDIAGGHWLATTVLHDKQRYLLRTLKIL